MSLFFDTRAVEGLSSLPSFGASLKFPVTRAQPQYTHWMFNRYPARRIADVPRCLIRAAQKEIGHSSIKVLDPFAGSGTTAVETLLAAAKAYGVEADPFARLIATVRTTPFSENDLRTLGRTAQRITECLKRSAGSLAELPDVPNVDYWFPPENIVGLRRLRQLIDHHCQKNEVKNFFLVVLAELVRPCSYAERQTLKPYISKRFPKQPMTVLDAWLKHLPRDLEGLGTFSRKVGSSARPIFWLGSDATSFKTDVKCDIAITSPPYVNALDYVRCTKFESGWLGLSSDKSRSELRKVLMGEAARVPGGLPDVIRSVASRDPILWLRKLARHLPGGVGQDLVKRIQGDLQKLIDDASDKLAPSRSPMVGIHGDLQELIDDASAMLRVSP